MSETLKRTITMKLAVIARQMRAQFDEQTISTLGVSRSQWTVIAVLASFPGATQREIAETLEISEVSAGRIVDRLCSEGLVERRRKEEDRRAHAVFLTEAGENLTSRLSDVARDTEESVFEGVEREDLKTFSNVLEQMAANLAGETSA